jgi:hypothetical protein
MGNQGYSHEATRVAAEILWSGEIGDVTEVHAWTGAPSWPQGLKEWPAEEKVPSTLDWDLWLGCVPARPYSSAIAPFNWRGYFDFGTGPLGDWGIHIFGPAHWGLQLTAPTSVEVIKQEGKSPITFPSRSVLRYNFPARGNMPPVTIYWYDAIRGMPDPYTPPGMTVEQMRPIPDTGPVIGQGGRGGARGGRGGAQPGGRGGGQGGRGGAQQGSGYNQIFVGAKGYLGTRGRGEGVGLIPGSRWAEYRLPPQFLTRSPGHMRDWLRACKGGEPACSNFSVAGPYDEWVTLGAIAYHFDGKLEWDAAKMQFTNNTAANEYLKPKFRKGWELEL